MIHNFLTFCHPFFPRIPHQWNQIRGVALEQKEPMSFGVAQRKDSNTHILVLVVQSNIYTKMRFTHTQIFYRERRSEKEYGTRESRLQQQERIRSREGEEISYSNSTRFSIVLFLGLFHISIQDHILPSTLLTKLLQSWKQPSRTSPSATKARKQAIVSSTNTNAPAFQEITAGDFN